MSKTTINAGGVIVNIEQSQEGIASTIGNVIMGTIAVLFIAIMIKLGVDTHTAKKLYSKYKDDIDGEFNRIHNLHNRISSALKTRFLKDLKSHGVKNEANLSFSSDDIFETAIKDKVSCIMSNKICVNDFMRLEIKGSDFNEEFISNLAVLANKSFNRIIQEVDTEHDVIRRILVSDDNPDDSPEDLDETVETADIWYKLDFSKYKEKAKEVKATESTATIKESNVKKTRVSINGVSISIESDIPDVSNAPENGPNSIELDSSNMKPESDPNAEAEYNAAEYVEDAEEVAKANESSVVGVALAKKNNISSVEAFVKAGFLKAYVFENIDEFFRSDVFKTGLAYAKDYAEKKGLDFAKNEEVERWCNTTLPGKAYRVTVRRGRGRIISVSGAILAWYTDAEYDNLLRRTRPVYVDIFFEKDGKTGAFKVKRFAFIKVGKNVKVEDTGIESTDSVPDTTQNAGPDTIELHEDAQKPADAAGAEYDASEHIDDAEDIAKANESSFIGITDGLASVEAFVKVPGSPLYAYSAVSIAEFTHHIVFKAGVSTAKLWAKNHSYKLATSGQVESFLNATASGKIYRNKLNKTGKVISVDGLVMAYWCNSRLDTAADKHLRYRFETFFVKQNGGIVVKHFATVMIGKKPAKVETQTGNTTTPRVSSESTDSIPDTTQNAGPDTIELHEDAQKPADAAGAEYDASEHVETPEDVEKANESTFFGLTMKGKSAESFLGKGKGTYKSSAEFFKSPEAKAAVETAKSWGTKKKWALATIADVKASTHYKYLTEAGFTFASAFGAAFSCFETKSKSAEIDIYFVADGKLKGKAFARIKLSPVEQKKATESTNPVDIAFDIL